MVIYVKDALHSKTSMCRYPEPPFRDAPLPFSISIAQFRYRIIFSRKPMRSCMPKWQESVKKWQVLGLFVPFRIVGGPKTVDYGANSGDKYD